MEVTISVHVHVAHFVGHLVAIVSVEDRQVSEHQIVTLLLRHRHVILLVILRSLLIVDIHLRHRINLILLGNLVARGNFLLGLWVELVDLVGGLRVEVIGWTVYEVVHLFLFFLCNCWMLGVEYLRLGVGFAVLC